MTPLPNLTVRATRIRMLLEARPPENQPRGDMIDGPVPEALTFDDVVLVPNKSAVLPAEVDTRTLFTRNIPINIPIVSAAMDTVTESRLAIALAQQGGIGIIHRS